MKNQVISLFGGEANLNDYLASREGKFILSTSNDKTKYKTCCHPEALLSKLYHNDNANTLGYATVWDEIYTIICSYFGHSNPCEEGSNMMNKAGVTQPFELMKIAAKEKMSKTAIVF